MKKEEEGLWGGKPPMYYARIAMGMDDNITLTRKEYKDLIAKIPSNDMPTWKKIASIIVIASIPFLIRFTGVEWWYAALFYFLGALAAILKARKW